MGNERTKFSEILKIVQSKISETERIEIFDTTQTYWVIQEERSLFWGDDSEKNVHMNMCLNCEWLARQSYLNLRT
jgi:hypothetical protein